MFIVYTLQCVSLRVEALFSGLLSLTVRVFITHCVPAVLLSSPRVPFVYSARLYDNTVFRPRGLLSLSGPWTLVTVRVCMTPCCRHALLRAGSRAGQRNALRSVRAPCFLCPAREPASTVSFSMTHCVPHQHTLSCGSNVARWTLLTQKKAYGIRYPVSDESNRERKEARNVRGNADTKRQSKRTQCLRSTETLVGRYRPALVSSACNLYIHWILIFASRVFTEFRFNKHCSASWSENEKMNWLIKC